MRHPTDKCILCKENEASQKGSHIIPKFFGKGLFYGTKPRYSIRIDKNGGKAKVQDIIKEDYLFCPNCEKGFNIYETYCSLRLERFNNIRYFNDFKRYRHIVDFEFIECKKIDIRIFNLFIYSIVWRISISDNYGFLGFKLSDSEEEKLRQILKKFSKPTQVDLINEIDNLKDLPLHGHVLVRPKRKLHPPNSMLSAYSYNDYLHQIHLVDYVLIYSTLKHLMSKRFQIINNNRLNGLVRIGLIEKNNWENFNKTMFKESVRK